MPVFSGARRVPARRVRPSLRDPRFAFLLAGQAVNSVGSWASAIALWGFAAYRFSASPEAISVTVMCWSVSPGRSGIPGRRTAVCQACSGQAAIPRRHAGPGHGRDLHRRVHDRGRQGKSASALSSSSQPPHQPSRQQRLGTAINSWTSHQPLLNGAGICQLSLTAARYGSQSQDQKRKRHVCRHFTCEGARSPAN